MAKTATDLSIGPLTHSAGHAITFESLREVQELLNYAQCETTFTYFSLTTERFEDWGSGESVAVHTNPNPSVIQRLTYTTDIWVDDDVQEILLSSTWVNGANNDGRVTWVFGGTTVQQT